MMRHLAHNRQCDSSIWTASRRACVVGPMELVDSSARNSVRTAPTPFLRHFLGPRISGCTRAQAKNTAIKIASSLICKPAQSCNGKSALQAVHTSGTVHFSVNRTFQNSFLLHAGRRKESVLVAGGGIAPTPSSPIIGGEGRGFICGRTSIASIDHATGRR